MAATNAIASKVSRKFLNEARPPTGSIIGEFYSQKGRQAQSFSATIHAIATIEMAAMPPASCRRRRVR